MLEVAGEILSLIVETIILRDCLVNAGTSLIWKVGFIPFVFNPFLQGAWKELGI